MTKQLTQETFSQTVKHGEAVRALDMADVRRRIAAEDDRPTGGSP